MTLAPSGLKVAGIAPDVKRGPGSVMMKLVYNATSKATSKAESNPKFLSTGEKLSIKIASTRIAGVCV